MKNQSRATTNYSMNILRKRTRLLTATSEEKINSKLQLFQIFPNPRLIRMWNKTHFFPETERYFRSNISFIGTVLLLNSSENITGLISKTLLEEIIKEVKHFTMGNQWRRRSAVMNCFKSIRNKRYTGFIKFHRVDFYSNKTKKLLGSFFNFVKHHTIIIDQYYVAKSNAYF